MEAHSELRLVTCLFLDIVGSTDAVVRLGPERMQRLLSDGFAHISGLIRTHGGVVEKYIGDAILGTFGIPIARPDDAERALRAAEACTQWARGWAAAGGLGVRAGVETGDLLVDPRALETQQRMMIGEAINLAARLQTLADPGQVVVGTVCREATADVALFDAMGAHELKGFGPVQAWRFTGFRELQAPPEIGFVGRDQELETLRLTFEGALGSGPRLGLIVGPPGQGKSRLAREAISRAREFRVLAARCRPGAEEGANTALRQLVEAEAGEASAEAIAARLDVLLGPAEGPTVASQVAHAAGLAVDPLVLAMSRFEQRELLARAWERYLNSIIATTPLCLLVEDVHWGDPLLLRILDHVASVAAGPLVVLATARPEFVGTALRLTDSAITSSGEPVAFHPGVSINVGPLGDEDAERLAELVGAGAHASAAAERAAGNPLFLIELARSGSSERRLPVNIQAAITAHLDELDPEDRELLQHASVAGERFDLREATVLAERDANAVVGGLARIAHRGFIVADGAGYRFDHALIRDVVYGRLPVGERLGLHARFATEGLDAADPEARAYHWWEALGSPDAGWVWADPERLVHLRAAAYRAHREAAVRAEQRNAHELALEFLKHAVELADALDDRAEAASETGRMHTRLGEGDKAWARGLSSIDLYVEAGVTPPAKVFADMLELTSFNWGYFHNLPSDAQVLDLMDRGIEIARASGDDVSLARLIGERASYTEDSEPAEDIRRLLAGPDPLRFAEAAEQMATVYLWTGRIGDSMELFEEVFDRLVPAGAHIFNEWAARAWFALAAYNAGDLPRLRALSDTLAAETEHLSVHTRSHAYAMRALLDFGIGDWDHLRQVDSDLRELVGRNPDASFCLLSAGTVAFAGASEVLASRPLPADLDEQVLHHVTDSELVRDAAVLLPKVMAGDPEALDRGLGGYEAGLKLWDRYRVWDTSGLLPAIALSLLGRWDDLAQPLARLDDAERLGSRLAGAVADAIREEERASRGGAPPKHEALRALGYAGISEILQFRPRPATREATSA